MKETRTEAAQIPRKSDRLFEAEANLRNAAVSYAGWDSCDPSANPTRTDILNVARRSLRSAALAFAKLANEIDGGSP